MFGNRNQLRYQTSFRWSLIEYIDKHRTTPLKDRNISLDVVMCDLNK